MKYLVGTSYLSKYVAVGYDGYLYTPNCMCYRMAKPKWFNSIDECKDIALSLVNAGKWERKYGDSQNYAPVYIYEAVTYRHVTEDGRPYTTVNCGKEVAHFEFQNGAFGWGYKV